MSKPDPRTWKAAVVGGGAFGEAHLRTYRSMPQVEVGGIYTIDAERGAALCGTYGGRSYESLDALANDATIDIVSIVTPEDRHLEAFRVLAGAGKAVYVEKPLATSLSEAREIAVLSRGIVAMSGHCLRFEQRLAGIFDELRGVPLHHLSFRNLRTRQEKATYGRVHPAHAMLCHEVELSNAFAASPFQRVLGMETRFSEGQVDGMTILIEYENGLTSTVEGGWYLPAQRSCIENDLISIRSARGVDEVTIPQLGCYRVTAGGMEVPNTFYGHSVYGVEYGPLRAALDYFVRCLADGAEPAVSTVADGFAAVELIEGALISAREGRLVSRCEIAA